MKQILSLAMVCVLGASAVSCGPAPEKAAEVSQQVRAEQRLQSVELEEIKLKELGCTFSKTKVFEGLKYDEYKVSFNCAWSLEEPLQNALTQFADACQLAIDSDVTETQRRLLAQAKAFADERVKAIRAEVKRKQSEATAERERVARLEQARQTLAAAGCQATEKSYGCPVMRDCHSARVQRRLLEAVDSGFEYKKDGRTITERLGELCRKEQAALKPRADQVLKLSGMSVAMSSFSEWSAARDHDLTFGEFEECLNGLVDLVQVPSVIEKIQARGDLKNVHFMKGMGHSVLEPYSEKDSASLFVGCPPWDREGLNAVLSTLPPRKPRH